MAILLGRTDVSLSTASPTFSTSRLPLAPQTAQILVRLRRPTPGNPLAWDETATIRVSILEYVDGREYAARGQATGGMRLGRAGEPYAEYSFALSPQKSAITTGSRTPVRGGDGKDRLQLTWRGETATTEYALVIRLELIRGTAATLDLLAVEAFTAVAPTIVWHRSVAYDNDSSGQEQTGDGVLDLTIDPVGTTDLAAWAHSGAFAATGGSSATYGGAAMTELHDAGFGTTPNVHSAYYKTGIGTGLSAVTHTMTDTTPGSHVFGIITMTGVNQSSPVGTVATATGTTADPMTVTVSSTVASGLVVAGLAFVDNGAEAPPGTVGADQTEQYRVNTATDNFFGVGSTQDGAAGGVMSWANIGAPSAVEFGLIAIEFKATPPTVTLSGTITSSTTEADVVAGGKTIILTVAGDTWVDNLATLQYVGGQVNSFAGTTANTDVTFALTGGLASTPAANDLVVVSFATGSTADRTLSITNTGGTAYTLIGSELYANDLFDTNFRAAYRFMPGTPETAVRFAGGTGNNQDAGTYLIQVFRNVDSSTPIDVTTTTNTGINTRLADPPSITPSTPGAWIVVVGACAGGTTATFTNPADLSDWRSDSQVDTNDSTIGGGYYTGWTSGAYDHAAFAGGGTDTTDDSWAAIAFVLRPATDSAFDNARDEIRDGVDSAQAEGTGWDALKSTIMPVGNVVRTSDTVVTITAQAAGTYNITAQETCTATVPAVALTGGEAVVATPTFTIDTGAGAAFMPRPPKRTLQAVNRSHHW